MNEAFEKVRKTIDERIDQIDAELEDLKAQITADEKTVAEAEKEHKEAVLTNDQKRYNAADLKKRLAEEHMNFLQDRVDFLESGRAITQQEAQLLVRTVNEEMDRFIAFQMDGIKKAKEQIAALISSTDEQIEEGNQLLMIIHANLWEERMHNDYTGEDEVVFPRMKDNDWAHSVLDAIPDENPIDYEKRMSEIQQRAERMKIQAQEETERDKREHPELWEKY